MARLRFENVFVDVTRLLVVVSFAALRMSVLAERPNSQHDLTTSASKSASASVNKKVAAARLHTGPAPEWLQPGLRVEFKDERGVYGHGVNYGEDGHASQHVGSKDEDGHPQPGKVGFLEHDKDGGWEIEQDIFGNDVAGHTIERPGRRPDAINEANWTRVKKVDWNVPDKRHLPYDFKGPYEAPAYSEVEGKAFVPPVYNSNHFKMFNDALSLHLNVLNKANILEEGTKTHVLNMEALDQAPVYIKTIITMAENTRSAYKHEAAAHAEKGLAPINTQLDAARDLSKLARPPAQSLSSVPSSTVSGAEDEGLVSDLEKVVGLT